MEGGGEGGIPRTDFPFLPSSALFLPLPEQRSEEASLTETQLSPESPNVQISVGKSLALSTFKRASLSEKELRDASTQGFPAAQVTASEGSWEPT